MIIYDPDDYRYFDRKTKEKIRIEEAKERAKEKKELNKSYLKGQRGVRLYFDKDQLFDEESENIGIEERKIKCFYTRDFRIEKLFGYLKYLKGRKILIRDLAWHFAVTERTIQHDLRWLENNGFVEVQKNKTKKGKPTKNSYIVNLEKEKFLPCENTFLNVVILSKQNNEMYVLTKTNYQAKDQAKKYIPISKCKFSLPQTTLKIETKLNDRSMILANNIFDEDISNEYKGYIFSDNYKIKKRYINEKWDYAYKVCRAKAMFSLFMLENHISAPKGYMWIKLEQANRYIKNTYQNKCLNYVKNSTWGEKN